MTQLPGILQGMVGSAVLSRAGRPPPFASATFRPYNGDPETDSEKHAEKAGFLLKLVTERRTLKLLLLACLLLALGGLYVYGALQQLTVVNVDLNKMDQGAYMDFARKAYESGFTYTGDRNRMPVYPFLQALFYRPGMSDAAFFRQGKYINLILSLVLLGGLALIFNRFFSSLHTLDLTLIVAFTVFIFKAGWFQAELLFYFISFSLFLLFWRLLERPSYGMGVLAGVVAGVAHLTKASILPGLIIFLGFMGVAWLVGMYWSRSRSTNVTTVTGAASRLVVLLLVGSVFLVTVFPYINESKRVFRSYFYNVNSAFYVWYDSWDEAKQGTRAHGDRVGWPDMPPEQIPSLSKYLREHTIDEIASRVAGGGGEVLRQVTSSYGYYKYLLLYGGFLLAAIVWQRALAWQMVRRHPVLLAFLTTYFVAYFLLYAWYAAIAAGNRLILAQFVPLLFTISMGLRALLRDTRISVGRPLDALTGINLVVLAVLAVDIYFVLTARVGTVYGGF